MANKWQVKRAGIVNYWYYDDAVFDFAGGRLMLRGSNGSGKSVTMQSLVTVLLDGETRASRLDSFGTQSRRIEDYLLGEKEVTGIDDRTGYLYFEYKREHTDQYITTGIGLRAKRGTGRVEFWGFILYNGKRIGKDFELYRYRPDPQSGEKVKVPLSRRELENLIDNDGQVVRERNAYKKLVNRYVFGFRDIEQFEDLMELLIQLRSPKLSRDFRPSVIYDILNASLPALSDDDLRPLSDTMESMDNLRLAIEQMKGEIDALTSLSRVYDTYNAAVLGERLVVKKRQDKMLSDLTKELAAVGADIEAAEARRQEAETRQRELSAEELNLRKEQEILKDDEAYRAAESKKEKEIQLARDRKRHQKKESDWQDKRRKELSLQEEKEKAERAAQEADEEISGMLKDLDALADNAAFHDHAIQKEGFQPPVRDEGRINVWDKAVTIWKKHLSDVIAAYDAFSRLQEKGEMVDSALGEEQKALDDLKQRRMACRDALEEARRQLEKAYFTWKAAYGDTLPVVREQELLAIFQELYDGTVWRDAEAVLRESLNGEEQKINAAIGRLEARLADARKAKDEAEERLTELRKTKEAEPERRKELQEARRQMEERGIAYLPLYEATEFRDEVSPEMRERIESALLDAGLLDALILKDDEASHALGSEMMGAVLMEKEPVIMGQSLFDYLLPVADEEGEIPEARIAGILSSIVVREDLYPASSDGRTVIDVVSGSYAQGNLSGHAPEEESARFIGRKARVAMRLREIAKAEEELLIMEQDIEKSEEERRGLDDSMQRLHEAYKALPDDRQCQKTDSEIQVLEKSIQMQEKRVVDKDAEKKEVILALRAKQDEIRILRDGDGLQPDRERYAEAREDMDSYQKQLGGLFLLQRDYVSALDKAEAGRRQIEEVRTEEDDLRGEILEIEDSIKAAEAAIAALVKVLESLDAAKIEARIAAIVERLGTLPTELRQTIEEGAAAANRAESLQGQRKTLEARIEERTFLVKAADALVESELGYGFCPEAAEKKGLAAIRERREKDGQTVSKIWSKVGTEYQSVQGVLAEYRIVLRDAEAVLPLPETVFGEKAQDLSEEFQSAWREIHSLSVRQIVLSNHSGPKSPKEELDALSRRYAEQRELLSKEDQRIYKEVIMNSVGRTISHYIYAAEDWLGKMNSLMQKSQTSSGLRFRLRWDPYRFEDGEDALDTEELVGLLHKDPAILTEEDRERIGKHFQKRVETARVQAENNMESADAWEEAVRDTLDYRRWFHFCLYYRKGDGMPYKELTDRFFNQFSGGEKAMAMYIPLFSAAYSRYQEAGEDAPYLITLDEAFAGVDEKNMRDMFRLVEDLGFNYIMNSQAIWGEYDVVPDLNIYELLRPQNAPFVSLAAFHWNGHRREILLTEEGRED